MQTGYDLQNHANYIDALKSTTDDARLKTEDAQARNQAAQQFSLGQLTAANATKSQAISSGIALAGSALQLAGQPQTQTPYNKTAFADKVNANYMIPSPLPADTIPAVATPSTMQAMNIPQNAGQLVPQNLTPLQALYYRQTGRYNYNPYRFN
jgi:hypothetical protein